MINKIRNPNCGIKLTEEQVINRFKILHGNKYNYSKVNYINNNTKVCIICKEHGEFWQSPVNHFKKHNCPKCVGGIKKTLEEFIEKAKNKWENKYNYSEVDYKNAHTKIKIICPEHGAFYQEPWRHLIGECWECGIKKRKISQEEIKNRFKKIHGDTYDYSKSIFNGTNKKIQIRCFKHGIFKITPNSHKYGHGCAKCYFEKQRMTHEEWVEIVTQKHEGIYDYSKTNFINYQTKVEIICLNHGSFWQIPGNHCQGRGCRKCSIQSSKKEKKWLDYLNIAKELRQIITRINGKIYSFDAADLEQKIIWEFYGDFWHGNLNRYEPNHYNSVNKQTFQELYNKTIIREQRLIEQGFKIISIWESDWDLICKNKIIKLI